MPPKKKSFNKIDKANFHLHDPLVELTARQKAFVKSYVISHNATRAAIDAGFSKKSAYAAGARLLANELVDKEIRALEKKIGDHLKLEAETILAQLFYCATRNGADFIDEDGLVITDIRRLPKRACEAIDAIEQEAFYDVDEDGNETLRSVKTKLKLVPKATAIDMAMKHKGLFSAERLDVKLSINWDDMYKNQYNPKEGEDNVIDVKPVDIEERIALVNKTKKDESK